MPGVCKPQQALALTVTIIHFKDDAGCPCGCEDPKTICGGCLAPALLDLATRGITDHTCPKAGHCHLAAACVPSVRWCHDAALSCMEWGGTVAFQMIPGT